MLLRQHLVIPGKPAGGRVVSEARQFVHFHTDIVQQAVDFLAEDGSGAVARRLTGKKVIPDVRLLISRRCNILFQYALGSYNFV